MRKDQKNGATIQNNVAKMWKRCIEPKIIFVNRLLYHLNTEICQRVRKNNWHHGFLKGSRFTCTLYWAIFVWPWKMVSVSVRYLFYQPMDEKIKTWNLCFPAKENPNMDKALFDWPIVFQYDIKKSTCIRDLKIPRYRCTGTGTGSVPVHVKCSCAWVFRLRYPKN